MNVSSTRERGYIDDKGEKGSIVLRRLQCKDCLRIHTEIPDFLVPYKRYSSKCIEAAVSGDPGSAPCEGSTITRWKEWVRRLASYWLAVLESVGYRASVGAESYSKGLGGAQSALAPAGEAISRLKGLVGSDAGWLKRIVRPVVNQNLWVTYPN